MNETTIPETVIAGNVSKALTPVHTYMRKGRNTQTEVKRVFFLFFVFTSVGTTRGQGIIRVVVATHSFLEDI